MQQRHLRRAAAPRDTPIAGMRAEERYIWRGGAGAGAGALHGFPAEGELLHGDYREHFAGGSPADSEDLHRRPPVAVSGGEALRRSKAPAASEEPRRQPRSDRGVRRCPGSCSASPVQRSLDAGTCGHRAVKPISPRGQ